ncbi:ImuA family protein [Xanthobacter pseudotagetidis]|uniref:ImuA family protein n=1 Tax=Xanthobacter pseudotagetidis TaxID=3119911 RepID=UPI003729EBC7
MPSSSLRERTGSGASVRPARDPATLDALRALVRGPARMRAPAGRLPLGAPLDAALGGGLARGALHEMHCGAPGAHGVLLGLAAAIAAGARGPVLWVRQDLSVREGGRLHALGCAELGLDPGRLVLVEAADAAGVLRAAEDGLRHGGAGVVIAEPWGAARVLDLTATRRLALRAAERGALALLLRPGAEPEPSAAATRWLAAAAAGSAAPLTFGLGAPAFALELARNRFGPTGRWIVEFDAHARRFDTLAPGAAPARRVPAAPCHRPAGDHGAPARRAAS